MFESAPLLNWQFCQNLMSVSRICRRSLQPDRFYLRGVIVHRVIVHNMNLDIRFRAKVLEMGLLT